MTFLDQAKNTVNIPGANTREMIGKAANAANFGSVARFAVDSYGIGQDILYKEKADAARAKISGSNAAELERSRQRNQAEIDFWEGKRKEASAKIDAAEKLYQESDFFSDFKRAAVGLGAVMADPFKKLIKNITGTDIGNISGTRIGDMSLPGGGDLPSVKVPDFQADWDFNQAQSQRNANAELQAASFGKANFGSGSVSEVKGLKEFSDSFGGGIDRARMAYTLPKFDMPSLDMFGGPQRPREFFEL